jgi:hypothetical protein
MGNNAGRQINQWWILTPINSEFHDSETFMLYTVLIDKVSVSILSDVWYNYGILSKIRGGT